MALFSAPFTRIDAQVDTRTASRDWQAWAFARVGPALTSQVDIHGRGDAVLGSAAGGFAGSYKALLVLVRAADTEQWSFSDSPTTRIRDYAILAGVRSRGDHLFLAAAAGPAVVAPIDALNGNGTLNSSHQVAPAFDLSAHADRRLGGVALTASGVLGPASTRYIAISFGVELGRLGS